MECHSKCSSGGLCFQQTLFNELMLTCRAQHLNGCCEGYRDELTTAPLLTQSSVHLLYFTVAGRSSGHHNVCPERGKVTDF